MPKYGSDVYGLNKIAKVWIDTLASNRSVSVVTVKIRLFIGQTPASTHTVPS